eukprot:SM000087S23383  [mRNA]  locus=s87:420457:423266:+ [translate_table: standard]
MSVMPAESGVGSRMAPIELDDGAASTGPPAGTSAGAGGGSGGCGAGARATAGPAGRGVDDGAARGELEAARAGQLAEATSGQLTEAAARQLAEAAAGIHGGSGGGGDDGTKDAAPAPETGAAAATPPAAADAVAAVAVRRGSGRTIKPRLSHMIEHGVFQEGDLIVYRTFPARITNRSPDVDKRLRVELDPDEDAGGSGGEPVRPTLRGAPLAALQAMDSEDRAARDADAAAGAKPSHKLGAKFLLLQDDGDGGAGDQYLLVSASFFKLLALWTLAGFPADFTWTSDQHAYDDRELLVVTQAGQALEEAVPMKAIRDEFAEEVRWDHARGECGCWPRHDGWRTLVRQSDPAFASPGVGGLARSNSSTGRSSPAAGGGVHHNNSGADWSLPSASSPSPPYAATAAGGAWRQALSSSPTGGRATRPALVARSPAPSGTTGRAASSLNIGAGGRSGGAGASGGAGVSGGGGGKVRDYERAEDGGSRLDDGSDSCVGADDDARQAGKRRRLDGDKVAAWHQPKGLATATQGTSPSALSPEHHQANGNAWLQHGIAANKSVASNHSGRAGAGLPPFTALGSQRPTKLQLPAASLRLAPSSSSPSLATPSESAAPSPREQFVFNISKFAGRLRTTDFIERARTIGTSHASEGGSSGGDEARLQREQERRRVAAEECMPLAEIGPFIAGLSPLIDRRTTKRQTAEQESRLAELEATLGRDEGARTALQQKFAAAANTLYRQRSYAAVRGLCIKLAMVIEADRKWVGRFAAITLKAVADRGGQELLDGLRNDRNVLLVLDALRKKWGRRNAMNAQDGDLLMRALGVGKGR